MSFSDELPEQLRSAAEEMDGPLLPLSRMYMQLADRVEAYEVAIKQLAKKNDQLREAVNALLQHEASSFFGPDEGKHKRASWRGVIRKARAALGEQK